MARLNEEGLEAVRQELVKATPERYELVSRFKVPSGGIRAYWAHPVVLDGRLYVRHSDVLYVYDVKAAKEE